jgi:hypothetical protein
MIRICQAVCASILIAVYLPVLLCDDGNSHCDDLPNSSSKTCSRSCKCCLRNSHYDDTSLLIVCKKHDNDINQPSSSFVDELTKLLRDIRKSEIVLKVFSLVGALLQAIPEELCATSSLKTLNLTDVHLTSIFISLYKPTNTTDCLSNRIQL